MNRRKTNNVLVKRNQAFPKRREIVLPKLNTTQTAPGRITVNSTSEKSDGQFPEHYREAFSRSLLPMPVPRYQKDRLPSPSFGSLSSDSDFYPSDYDDSQFSETTEISEIDPGFLETLKKEVSKRVISGMVLATKCGETVQGISEKNLGKRVEKFLDKPKPAASVICPRHQRPPRLLTPLTSSRPQHGDTWCLRQQKVSKVFGDSLRAVYGKSREGKCRYIRAPLTPIPSIDWVFEKCRNDDRTLSRRS